jgi:hypothetical protein
MKNEMNQDLMNPALTDVDRKTMAVQMAYKILNDADFDLVVEEDGSMSVFSSDGDIVLDRVDYVRFMI